MQYYNLENIIEDWVQQQSKDYPDMPIKARPNLDNLKLSVEPEDIHWTEIKELVNEESQRVNVEYNPMKPDLYSGLQASKESEMITKVKLNGGVVHGINKQLRLPVNYDRLRSIVGDYVSIDPGTAESTSSNKMTVTLGSSHLTNVNQPTQARVSTRQTTYKVSFTAKVVCRGNVLFTQESTDEQKFPEIIKDLRSQDKVHGLRVNLKKGVPESVSWQMTGSCEFRGEFEQEIDWQQR